jgi:hypothetical protein
MKNFENNITKFVLKFVLAAVLVALGVIVAFAYPFSVTCPIDGGSMYFDHQVGFGSNAVCWYSHYGTDPQTGRLGHHEAYIGCGN